MSDLTQAQWRSIIDESVYLPQDGERGLGRYIAIGKLQNIIKKSRRSNDQNAMLWALYDDALRQGGETLGGWTRADLHDWLLGTHFGWDTMDALGMTRRKPKKRSSRLTKTEFSDLLETLVREMAQHGIVLQLPGDKEIAA